MLREKQRYLHQLPPQKFLQVAESLCHGSLQVEPIYECIKVFARLTESGQMSYARHSFDLGTELVSPSVIASRLKDQDRSEIVKDYLTVFEEAIAPIWPFAPGSSSWVQLELLHPNIRLKGPINKPSIVLRKAVRLSSLNKAEPMKTSPLIERIFLTLEKKIPVSHSGVSFVFSPTVTLKNIAGSGVITESREGLESGADVSCIAEALTEKLLKSNFPYPVESNPGFYVKVEGAKYRVVSTLYKTAQNLNEDKDSLKLPPLPIVGIRR